MLSRRLLRRVLIVPPAGLVGNWRGELLKRLTFQKKHRSEPPYVGCYRFLNRPCVGSGSGDKYSPPPTSVTRKAVPGLIRFLLQYSSGSSTCRFGETLIVVVTAQEYFIANQATSPHLLTAGLIQESVAADVRRL
jgi:hypothetical protein